MKAGYQDVWSHGEIVARGERDCGPRYDAIAAALDGIDEPFTVLDLGAYTGYFAVRLAEDFNCHVVAVDDNPQLPQAASDRITVVNRRVDAEWLANRRRRDVILALSVLHHFRDWRAVLDELRCRHAVFLEVPHPDETWMRSSAGRRDVAAIHKTVVGRATKRHGTFERVGRDGVTYQRPLVEIAGKIVEVTGTVFAGSGSCSRKLPLFSDGLAEHLGYEPYMGSLNLRLGYDLKLDDPHVDWVGRNRNRTRDYQFWEAWIDGYRCHAMVPGTRGHRNSIEIVAPDRLRHMFNVGDGDRLTVDIDTNQ